MIPESPGKFPGSEHFSKNTMTTTTMNTKMGIQRCDLATAARWPRDATYRGRVDAISDSTACVFVKFGNERATCSKAGVLRGADRETLKVGEMIAVRIRSIDVERNRCTLELASASRSSNPAATARRGDSCCFRCGLSGHRAKECTASRGRRARGSDTASVSSTWDSCSVQTDATSDETPCGNSKQRRRARREGMTKQTESLEWHICEMLRSALARKGVSFSPFDEEETLRDKLVDARNDARPCFRLEPESSPTPPPIKFGSFGTSDTLITASLVDEIASGLEPPSSLLRRLSSAGAA